MKARMILLGAVVLVVVSASQGQETKKDKLGINLNTRIMSKHIWRGFDRFDDKGAVQPSINLDWFGTGFSSTVWSCWALSSGSENQEEIDYVVAYSGSCLQDTPYATNYSVNWIYYDYPNTASEAADAQEIGVGFSWLRLIPLGNSALVPSYYVGKVWPARSDAINRECGGWVHILGLSYDLSVPGFLPGKSEQVIHLSTEMVYNDGMGGGSVDHDWSHVLLGISTGIAIGDVTIRPELNYQISMDDSVNDENELWCGLSISYRF